ncbi:MAG: M23 family metallopeptidase [Archangiaceae bacterium]|nr:M23 family metallopeptidase [Archangiaceae bacterium]
MMWFAVLASLVLSETHDERLETGRRLTQTLLDSRLDELWQQGGASFKRGFGGSVAGLKQFRARLANDFGEELRVTSDSIDERTGLVVYTRQSTFSRWALGVEMQWVWDPGKGALVSVSARPAFREAPSPHEDYVPKVELKLPFRGTWTVLWGGRTWEVNRHSSVADMRYATDLWMLKKGSSCTGDCTKNEQYFCWGKPVVAPADGTVVFVESSRPDNRPNAPDPNNLFGNHVVIDHGNSEYSLLAHLHRGSVVVKKGEKVTVGEIIAVAGNSGMSTEPHLHYQLMDGPDWSTAQGLPARFFRYNVDGKPVEVGELKRGQYLSP